jgi:hypothetical protein
MPDISMCRTKECPKRFDCVRAMAVPSTYQSMSDFYTMAKSLSGDGGDSSCEWFYPIEYHTYSVITDKNWYLSEEDSVKYGLAVYETRPQYKLADKPYGDTIDE